MNEPIQWINQRWRVSDLKDWPRNPRKLTKKGLEDLKKSIQSIGYASPLEINLDGTIIGGHARKKILRDLGFDEIDVRVPERLLTEEEMAEANVRLNKNVAGEFDFDILANEFELSDLTDWGFEPEELGIEPAEPEEDEAPEVSKREPVVKLGDIFRLGRHRIMCGDSTTGDVALLMDGEKIELANCDPPYGISIVGGGKPHPFAGKVHGPRSAAGTPGGKVIMPNEYEPVIGDDSTDTAIACYGLLVELKAEKIVLWGGNYFADQLPASRCWLVWDKENTGSFADAELAWTNQDKIVRLFRHQWSGLIKASERGESRVHPTQKPVALAKWVIETLAPESANVTDLFLGGGWTLLACEELGKRCFGMELSPSYIEVIIRRWAKLGSTDFEHLNGPLTLEQITSNV